MVEKKPETVDRTPEVPAQAPGMAESQTPTAPDETSSSTVSAERRKMALSQAIARDVALGYRIESQSDYQAVMVKGKKVSHLLHLVLTILTAGLWGLVWIALWIINRERREILQVDEYGNVLRQPV